MDFAAALIFACLLTSILNEDGFFDACEWKKGMPTGWVHLPAPTDSPEDRQLGSIAEALKKPYARYMKESWTNSYGTPKRKFAGTVVPAEDADWIARAAEEVLRGNLEIGPDGLREVRK